MTQRTITMIPVESSQIHSIGHDAASDTLAIRFKSFKGEATSLYHYDNFTVADFDAFRNAESIGKHFGQHIKTQVAKHPFTKVDESATAAIGIKTLRFQGYSDDTFGEIDVTHDDYDNCASGDPIEYLITSPSQPNVGLVITGQHCPGGSGAWLIGVSNYDPEYDDRPMPMWPARFAPANDARYANEPSLLIDVPADFVLRCLQRDPEAA